MCRIRKPQRSENVRRKREAAKTTAEENERICQPLVERRPWPNWCQEKRLGGTPRQGAWQMQSIRRLGGVSAASTRSDNGRAADSRAHELSSHGRESSSTAIDAAARAVPARGRKVFYD